MKFTLALLLMLVPFTALNCTQPSSPDVNTTESAVAVCGDGSCAPGVEDCGTCPGDCPCPDGFTCSQRQCVPVCGDGSCAPGVEDCGTCPVDCPCPGGLTCQYRQCLHPCALSESCGPQP